MRAPRKADARSAHTLVVKGEEAIKVRIYSEVNAERTSPGRIRVCAYCGCKTMGNTFRPCNIHKAVKDELEPVFLQRLREDQERYDAGLNVTPEMLPEQDRSLISATVKEQRVRRAI